MTEMAKMFASSVKSADTRMKQRNSTQASRMMKAQMQSHQATGYTSTMQKKKKKIYPGESNLK